MATIYDVAELTGFSISTVSRALRGLPGSSADTRRIVRATAEALGYAPMSAASALAGGRTGAIGVVVSTLLDLTCASLVHAASAELREAKFDLLLVDCGQLHPGEARAFTLESLIGKTDGILVVDVDFTEAERESFFHWAKPVRRMPFERLPAARQDRATRDLVQQMLADIR